MISGKSMTLIRAACSVTGASAATSLGQETRPLSIQTTLSKSRPLPRPITTGEASQTRSTLPPNTAAATASSTDDWSFGAPLLPVPNDADRLDTFNKDLSSDQSDLTHDKEEEDEEEEDEEEEDEEEEDEEEDKDLSSDQSDLTSYRLKWLKSSRRAESPHIHRQKRCQGKYDKCSKDEDCCSGRRCLGTPRTHQFCL